MTIELVRAASEETSTSASQKQKVLKKRSQSPKTKDTAKKRKISE